MEPNQNFAVLTESDLDRLEELLDADNFNGETLQLDELQGFLCALASGPEMVDPEEWIPAVLGGDPNYQNDTQRQEIGELLVRFLADVSAALADGDVPDLILYPASGDGAEGYDFAAWADGYLYGTQVGETGWLEAAGEHGEYLSELMEDFFILNGALKDDAIRNREPWVSPAEEARLMAQAQDGLHDRIASIYEFWKSLRTPIPTLRRESPKVGRNDPCPCGSGKKFKQCCGAPKKLH